MQDLAEPAPITPPPQKKWVLHATTGSQAKGQISILACAEVIVAVSIYAWIAEHFDTHGHLLSSVFILPLLLMRSEKSIETGIKLFIGDWFGLDKSCDWSGGKRYTYGGIVVALSILVSLFMPTLLNALWPGLRENQTSNMDLWFGFWCCVLSGSLAFVLKSAMEGAHELHNGKVLGVVFHVVFTLSPLLVSLGAIIGNTFGIIHFNDINLPLFFSGILLGALVGCFLIFSIASYSKLAGIDDDAFTGFGVGYTIRALICRFLATFLHLRTGVRKIPENWKETHFLTDITVLPEVVPGMRKYTKQNETVNNYMTFTLDGLITKFKISATNLGRQPKQLSSFKDFLYTDRQRKLFEKPLPKAALDVLRTFLFLHVGLVFFLPALAYRLNIKATAWLWWVLAFLSKPPVQPIGLGNEYQKMCHPLTNLVLLLVNLFAAFLGLTSLCVHQFDAQKWRIFAPLNGLPPVLKGVLALDWAILSPWNWALWVVEGSTVMMILMASHAFSYRFNKNWETYRSTKWGFKLWMMETIGKIRALGVGAYIAMAVGALSLHAFDESPKAWVPEKIVAVMAKFYHYLPALKEPVASKIGVEKLRLSWRNPHINDTISYEVKYKEVIDGSWIYIDNKVKTTVEKPGLDQLQIELDIPKGFHSFRVRAFKEGWTGFWSREFVLEQSPP